MTRSEFSKPYLVALYIRNRENYNVGLTIREIINEFDLPRDKYLETEVLEYLSSQGLVISPPGAHGLDYPMTISPNGKAVAESWIDGGVSAVSRNQNEHGGLYSVKVPASDRIVKLDDNSALEFETEISAVVDQLEQHTNGDPEQPGLRERLIGQLRAGRELIRAGEFRAYLLYEVLVRALGEIIEKYGNETIKSLAQALLGALVAKIIES